MRIILNDPIEVGTAASIAEGFLREFGEKQKDCIYRRKSDGLVTYVKRTKTGVSVRQWVN